MSALFSGTHVPKSTRESRLAKRGGLSNDDRPIEQRAATLIR